MDMNVRILKKFLFGAVLLLALLPVTNSYADPCGINPDGFVVFPGSAGCEYEPTTYSLTVYKLGLCTSAPAPTTTSEASLSSCATVYENEAGFAVSVSSTGSPVALSGGTVTVPPAGDYGFAYVLLSNIISVATSVTFSIEQTGQVGSTTPGLVCWTVAGNQSVSGGGSDTTSSCGTSVGTVGTSEVLVDSFGEDEHGAIRYTVIDNLGAAGTLTPYLLLPSTGFLAAGTTPPVTDRIFALQTFVTPVTVPAEPTSLDVAFKSSTALGIQEDSNGEVSFSGGPFAVKITVK